MPLHFVNPNYHVILIHYPLGVFVLGVFLELFSLLWRKGSIRVAAMWMIMLGAFLSLPAVTSGIYALHDVAANQGISGDRYILLRNHVWFQSGASLLAVICCLIGLGASDKMRKTLRLPLLLGVVIACGGMVLGSWAGGETIYQQGTSVLIINRHGKIQEIEQPDKDISKYDKIVDYYVGGEEQAHLIIAGFAFSAIVGALGLSFRRLTTHRAEELQLEAEGYLRKPAAAQGKPRRVTDDLSMIRSLNPESEVEADLAHVPAGRWWLVAVLVILATSTAGYWIISTSDFANAAGWNGFVNHLKLEDAKKWEICRHLAHAGLGAAMVLLALILAIIARFAPRRPLLLGFFALLMLAVVSAQIWIGILLTFDGGKGSLTHFRTPAAKTSDEDDSPSSSPSDTKPTTVPAAPIADSSTPIAPPVVAPAAILVAPTAAPTPAAVPAPEPLPLPTPVTPPLAPTPPTAPAPVLPPTIPPAPAHAPRTPEAPKADAPAPAPKTPDALKADAPTPDAPKVDAPAPAPKTPDALKADAPTPDAPKADAPAPAPKTPDAPKAEAPTPEAPKADAPTPAPKTPDAPSDAPKADQK